MLYMNIYALQQTLNPGWLTCRFFNPLVKYPILLVIHITFPTTQAIGLSIYFRYHKTHCIISLMRELLAAADYTSRICEIRRDHRERQTQERLTK